MARRLHNPGDNHCAILSPGGIGKADDELLVKLDCLRSRLYLQSKRLTAPLRAAR